MQVQHKSLSVNTNGKGFTDITNSINEVAQELAITDGLCNIFVKHTSCSLIISENSDPDVLTDLSNFMANLVSENSVYKHACEGKDDMPAHIRSVLTQTNLSIPISQKRLDLGTWQAIYLWEHRYQSYLRKLSLTIIAA